MPGEDLEIPVPRPRQARLPLKGTFGIQTRRGTVFIYTIYIYLLCFYLYHIFIYLTFFLCFFFYFLFLRTTKAACCFDIPMSEHFGTMSSLVCAGIVR